MRLRSAGLSLLFILGGPELARPDAGSETGDHFPDEGRLVVGPLSGGRDEDLPNVHMLQRPTLPLDPRRGEFSMGASVPGPAMAGPRLFAQTQTFLVRHVRGATQHRAR